MMMIFVAEWRKAPVCGYALNDVIPHRREAAVRNLFLFSSEEE
jgi:hypothetical protein